MRDLTRLPAHAGKDELNVIIETPRGNRNKFNYDPELGLFVLGKLLPPGAVFPYDFGFIPSTLGEDGDPLDVLMLMDEPVPVGCLIRAWLIGVIEAEQTEDGQTVRNDRLLAVAAKCHAYCETRALSDLSPELVEGIEHFFVSYNEMEGKRFKPIGRRGRKTAEDLVAKALRRAQRARRARKKAVKK